MKFWNLIRRSRKRKMHANPSLSINIIDFCSKLEVRMTLNYYYAIDILSISAYYRAHIGENGPNRV